MDYSFYITGILIAKKNVLCNEILSLKYIQILKGEGIFSGCK